VTTATEQLEVLEAIGYGLRAEALSTDEEEETGAAVR
jgi:hypothetical protein